MLNKSSSSRPPPVLVVPVQPTAVTAAADDSEPQVRDLRRLHEFSSRMAATRDVDAMLRDTLDSALAVNGARQGVIFLPHPERDGLRPELSAGLDPALLRSVEFVAPNQGASGRAYTERRRVVIADTETDETFRPFRDAIRASGIRSVHSTPLITREGHLVAVLAIYFPAPHLVSEREMRLIDLYARQAADLIEGAQLRERLERELAQRKDTEQALRRSEERLRLALSSGKVGVWDWDIVNDSVTWTPSLYQIHGLTPETFDGTVAGFRALVHPDDRPMVEGEIGRALQGNENFQLEFRAVRPDGDIRWLFTNATVSFENGRAVRMLGGTLDITALRQADLALRTRERQMKEISDALPALISYVGRDYRYIFCNRAYEAWFALKTEQIIGFTMADVLGASAWKVVQPFVDRALAGQPVDFEAEVPYARGGTRSVHIVYTPHRDSTDRIVGVMIIVSDVSALRKADNERQRLAAIVASSQEAILSKDLAGTVTSWNSACERLYGFSAAEMIGRNVTSLLPPGREKEEQQIIERVRQGEQVERLESIRVTKDGRLIDVLLTVSPIKDVNGVVIGASTIARDNTDRKRAELALRSSEERFRALANHAPVGIFLSGPDGGCVFVNESWCRMTGLPPQDARGEGWANAVHPDDRDAVLDGWRRAVAQGSASSTEFRFRRPDGRTVWVQGHAVVFRDRDRFTGFLGTFIDITDRKNNELDSAFLQQLSERLGTIEGHEELTRTAVAAIGKHLDADRAYVLEIEDDQATAVVAGDWRREGLAPLAGRHPLAQYGSPELRDLLRCARARVADVAADPATTSGAALFASHDIRSFATSANFQQGRWVATLAVTSRARREWSDRECGLLENAVARVWPMVQQARTMEALRESEQLYRALGDSINFGFWVCDAAGRNIFASNSFLNLVGMTQEQCSASGWMDILHPDDAEATAAAWAECVRSGTFWEREHRFRGIDGEWHPVLARGVPIRDASGRIVRWAGINLDIADWKKTDATARQRMNALEILNATGSSLAAEHDAERIVDTVTKAARELTRAAWSTLYLNAENTPGQACPLPSVSGASREALAGFPPRAVMDSVFQEGNLVRAAELPPAPGGVAAHSCLGVPIRSRSGRVLAGLFLGHPDLDFFTPEAATGIAALAAQAAVALDNAHLYAASQRELAAMNRLHALNTRLVGAGNLAQLLDEVLRSALEVMDTDKGTVQLFDAATQTLELVAHRGFDEPFLSRFRHVVLAEWGDLGRTTLGGGRSIIEDVEQDPLCRAHLDVFRAAGVRSTQSTPLVGREGQLIGLLTTHRSSASRPDPRDLQLLDLLGSHASGFIDRTRSQELVRAREQQLRLITDHAPIYLAQTDAQYRFKFVNRTYADRYGIPREQILGKTVPELTGEKAFAVFKHHMDNTLAGNRTEFEEEIPYQRLGSRWVHVLYEPERDATGQVVGLVAVIVDVTARKQAERELERARDEAVAASRAKDDFLAALSHELRTPLSPVLLVASDAASNPSLPSDIRASFELIRSNVSLEARLIDDLLDLTRITRGKMSLDKQHVDVHGVMREALAAVQADAAAKSQRITVALEAANARVLGDPVRLQQVLWNVLKNAVKFTPDQGQISITTRNAGEHVLVAEVTDTGIGMLPDELARAFDAFAQGDHATPAGPHRFGGLGLGLAISQKLVQLHDGRIHAKSLGRNCGSTFILELPLANMTSPTAGSGRDSSTLPRETPSSDESQRPRLLLVEDHAATRQTLEKLLTRRNYTVITAASATEARQVAASTSFDLVVSDVGLPDGDGYQLMAELRQKHPELSGIALSGYGMEDDLRRSQAAGFAAHLVKPVSMGALERAITSLVRK